ncbi:Xaa-Pro peptidase family protein [Lederbergia sp. NSJ-179]|uniref:M24 family metallopeptidase n=1 Tax=Lederbergia sp. NSJ-179 TaxID=2931402 RepID=UPI001FD30EC8|nr:Xaa-Pro peptidase family protein [Lederbergia sp. NSJ-179]MCJ7842376.1 Xaa-Pro peptidase family protein [Lederbergia sp. NSJ-179]
MLLVEKIREQLEKLQMDGMLISKPENVRYLTNFTGTSGVVIVSRTKAIFLTDFRYDKQAHEQITDYDIHICGQSASMMETIVQLVKSENMEKFGFEASFVTYDFYLQLNEKLDVGLCPTTNVVESLRLVKTEMEVEKLRKAASIADLAFEHILNFIRPGVTEIEVANELEFCMRKNGATSNSSIIIVASGSRSALPHGVASEKVIEKGDMVTLDFGALYEGYRSDMTRTVAVGDPHPKLKEIYQIVLDALLQCTAVIKHGMPAEQADAIVRDFIKKEGYGDYFGHGAGHGIGLMIHEDPFLSPRSTQDLQAGMVITVEPGIYLPDLGGVRIEDDLFIKQNGNEILTKSPRDLIIL